MTTRDLLGLTAEALSAHRMRYGLSALAIAVGVAAVVLLASIGEGTKRYIERQITQFGTTLIAVNPGKATTTGIPGLMGGTQKKLSLEDARALRRIPGVAAVAPLALGTALVERDGRGRRVYIYGTTTEATEAWSWNVATGSFLPETDWDQGGSVTVLGSKLKSELFGSANALGARVRIGQWRFRVIGIMESKGSFLGLDLDDAAFIPVASALKLLNLTELGEIDLLAASQDDVESIAAEIEALIKERHAGQEDVTITTQVEGMEMVDRILGVVTGAVTGIAAISLLVGAIGILTIMWIVVRERRAEIGLIKALGSKRSQIMRWYLFEAAVTAFAGGLAGLLIGMGLSDVLRVLIPGLESHTPPEVVLAALAMALAVGLGAGVFPALQAARLDPVEALRAK